MPMDQSANSKLEFSIEVNVTPEAVIRIAQLAGSVILDVYNSSDKR